MNAGTCYIVGAGDFSSRGLVPRKGDLLIAADGGLIGLKRLGLKPQVMVGDMDSFTGPVRGVPYLRFPVRKDDTDLGLAIKLGLSHGFRRFRLYGVSGGPRADHFLAALQFLAGLSAKGLEARLVAPFFTVFAVTNSNLLLSTRPGATVSVFSVTPLSRGVTLRGLSYPGNNLTLSSHNPLGVSNAATGSRALVGVRRGTLLVWQGL